ncbi:MAG: hypothetical protein Q8O72_14200 [Bacteroidales bacterium]|nr:hypothetical protein [Bacteroidales bacterium]
MKCIFLSITFSVFSIVAFSQVRWEVILNDNNLDYYGITSCLSYDGGLLIAAKTQDINTHVFKLDRNGLVLWHKTILLHNSWLSIIRIKQNANGEILLSGNANGKAILIMMDPCGEPIWCNFFENTNHYQSVEYHDAVFLENGDVIALTWLYTISDKYDVAITSFDKDGNFLWFNPFSLYETLYLPLPFQMQSFDDFVIITGDCYSAYPDNPNVVYLRPLIVKTDNNYNKEWVLTYGMSDTILGDARGVVSFDGNIFHGFGSYTKLGFGSYNSILLNFDINGIETSYIGIDNGEINQSVTENFFLDLEPRDDTSYFASAKFGNSGWENPLGEWIMDTVGHIFQYQSHENTTGGFMPLHKYIDNKFQLTYQLNYSDILLYKLNPDLSQAAFDTTIHVYDSLCDHPIVSDTIYLNGCNVITGIEEVPTPEEYFASLKTILLTISPNPATGSVRFEMGNTAYHKNIMVQVFGINGNRVFEQPLASGQSAISPSVAAWPDGLYLVVASSSMGGSGSAKFVVKK